METKGRIAKAAGLMSIATFISRILGYIKDMILARYFGASGIADVFFVAFRIPNLLRELFAEGSMSSAFVPVVTEYQTRHGRQEADMLVRSVFIFILIVVGLICIIGIIFSPTIVTLIAPGFLKDPEKFANTVLLTRIMFPFLLFISLASLAMGALNTRGVFFIPAFAPAVFNIVVIISIITLSMKFTNPIIAVAVGVTAGGLFQFLFQLPSFLSKGFRLFRIQGSYLSVQDLLHPGLKRIGLLIIPSTAGMAVAQINIFVSTILASYLPDGSITYLYYSMRLIQFPVGVFGVAVGMAVLPTLSEHSAKGEIEKIKEDFSFALRLLFFITLPAMFGLISLNVPIVSTLFQRGKFDYIATIATSDALIFYSLGIWAIVGVRVVTSAFYSMQDTKTPVKIAALAVTLNIILSIMLMGPMRHNGLAFANAMASSLNFVLLFYYLRKRLGGVGAKRIARSFVKTTIAASIMGIAGWFISRGEIWKLTGYGFQKAAYLLALIIVCSGIYFALSFLMKSEEIGYIINKISGKKK